jgi:hypothetical protein
MVEIPSRYLVPRPEIPEDQPLCFLSDFVYGVDKRYWEGTIIPVIDNEAYIKAIGNGEYRQILNAFSAKWDLRDIPLQYLAQQGYFTSSPLYGYHLTEAGFQKGRTYTQKIDESNKLRVFLSYRSMTSGVITTALYAHLRSSDFCLPLVDRDLQLGDDWRETLRSLIMQSDALVVVVGPETFTSKHVVAEVELARELDIPILPLCHDANLPSDTPNVIKERETIFLRLQTDYKVRDIFDNLEVVAKRLQRLFDERSGSGAERK